MQTASLYPPGPAAARSRMDDPAHGAAQFRRPNILRRAEAWLDDRGRPAWIGATVLGFVAAWPVGLGLLGWSLCTGKFKRATFDERNQTMFCRNARDSARNARHQARQAFNTAFRSSGNSAFDAYKAETLRRLETEQEAFESFLARLREAKDKQEFDRFMDERAADAAAGNDVPNEGKVEEAARSSY